MSDFQAFQIQSHDFDEISTSLSRWDQTYRQLSAGFFRGNVEYIHINGIEIFELDWGQVIHYQGLTPPGTIAFGLPLNLSGQSRYLNRPVNNNDLLIQHRGDEGDLVGSQNFKIHVLTINEQRFLDKVQMTLGTNRRQQLQHVNRITLAPGIAETLRRKFQHLILQASSKPSINNPSTDLIGQLAGNLLDSIVSIVIAVDQENTRPRWMRQRQLVKKAQDCMWSQPTIAPRIDTVCRKLGTSERSLRDAFKTCTGMSASAYLKVLRLNQVRKILKSRPQKPVRVQDVAFCWGFSHMGQFAADYKQLFGEGPSETLNGGKLAGRPVSWQRISA